DRRGGFDLLDIGDVIELDEPRFRGHCGCAGHGARVSGSTGTAGTSSASCTAGIARTAAATGGIPPATGTSGPAGASCGARVSGTAGCAGSTGGRRRLLRLAGELQLAQLLHGVGVAVEEQHRMGDIVDDDLADLLTVHGPLHILADGGLGE